VSGAAGTLALALLAAAAAAGAISLATALLWPLGRRVAERRRTHPRTRARILRAAALAPAALPAALLAASFTPGVLGLLGLPADHCLAHPEHPHVCLAHPLAALTAPRAALLGVAGALLGLGALRAGGGLRRARRQVAALRLGVVGSLAPGVARVDSGRPFSLAAGLWRPEIFVSTGLAEGLSPGALRAVVEHERAHARGRDALSRAVVRVASLAHLPPLRRRLLAAHALAAERACDEEAGAALGDRLGVAEAILAAERLHRTAADAPPAPAAFPAFEGVEGSVPARVRGLLAPPPRPPAPAVSRRELALIVTGLVLVAPALHHGVEHLLAALVGPLSP